MQVTEETRHMCKQYVPGSLSSSHTREPGNEASLSIEMNGRTFKTFGIVILWVFTDEGVPLYSQCHE